MTLTSWLERCSSNQEPIDIGLLAQVLAVLLTDATTIYDSGLLGNLLADLLLQPRPDSGMYFLCLLGAGHLPGSDGPDGFVGNDNLGPVLDLFLDSPQLRSDDFDGFVALSLFQRLSTAENDADSTIESSLGLRGNELIVFLEDHTTLGVAQEGPGDIAIFELID